MRPDDQDEEEDEDDRITNSLAGLAIVLFLAVGLVFVMEKYRALADLEDCFMSGRSNCMPLHTQVNER